MGTTVQPVRIKKTKSVMLTIILGKVFIEPPHKVTIYLLLYYTRLIILSILKKYSYLLKKITIYHRKEFVTTTRKRNGFFKHEMHFQKLNQYGKSSIIKI